MPTQVLQPGNKFSRTLPAVGQLHVERELSTYGANVLIHDHRPIPATRHHRAARPVNTQSTQADFPNAEKIQRQQVERTGSNDCVPPSIAPTSAPEFRVKAATRPLILTNHYQVRTNHGSDPIRHLSFVTPQRFGTFKRTTGLFV